MKGDVKKSLLVLSVLMSASSFLVLVLYKTVLTNLSTPMLSPIVCYFWILEAIITVTLANVSIKGGQTYTNTFLILKTIKIMLSAIFLGVSLFIIKEGRINIVIAFALFYLLALLYEIISLTKLNKNLKNEVAKKQDI